MLPRQPWAATQEGAVDNPSPVSEAEDVGGDIVDFVSAQVQIGHSIVRCLQKDA